MNGFVVWCLKGPFSTPAPQAKPRSISLDLRSLSLDGAGPPLPLKPRYASQDISMMGSERENAEAKSTT